MNSLKKDFFSGLITGAGGFVLKAGSNILLIPFLIQALGSENFGFFIFILTFAEFLLMMDVGLTSGLIHRVSHYLTLNDDDAISDHLVLGHLLYGGLTLILIGASFFVSPILAGVINLSGEVTTQLAVTLLVLAFWDGAFNLYGNFFQAILKSHCLHRWTNTMDALRAVMGNILAVILVLNGFDLIMVMAARLFSTVLVNMLIIIKTVKVEYDLPSQLVRLGKLQGIGDKLAQFNGLLKISAWAMLQKISVFLSLKANDFVIASFLTLTDMAIYGLVYRVFTQVLQFSLRILEGLSPVFIRFVSGGEAEKSRFFYLRITSFITFLSGGLVLLIAGYYPEIIGFMGSGKISWQDTIVIGAPLAVIVWSGAATFPASNYLFSAEKQRFLTTSSIITALISLALAITTVKIYGLIGIAFSVLATQLIRDHGFVIRKTRKLLNISLMEFMFNCLIKNSLPLLLMLGIIILSRQLFLMLPDVMVMIAFGGLSFAFASVAWLLLSASAVERTMVIVKLSDVFKIINHKFNLKLPIKKVS